jgi:hypothetical protein
VEARVRKNVALVKFELSSQYTAFTSRDSSKSVLLLKPSVTCRKDRAASFSDMAVTPTGRY